MDKNKNKKILLELDELEKVTGGTGETPKKDPKPISNDTEKNI